MAAIACADSNTPQYRMSVQQNTLSQMFIVLKLENYAILVVNFVSMSSEVQRAFNRMTFEISANSSSLWWVGYRVGVVTV